MHQVALAVTLLKLSRHNKLIGASHSSRKFRNFRCPTLSLVTSRRFPGDLSTASLAAVEVPGDRVEIVGHERTLRDAAQQVQVETHSAGPGLRNHQQYNLPCKRRNRPNCPAEGLLKSQSRSTRVDNKTCIENVNVRFKFSEFGLAKSTKAAASPANLFHF